MDELVPGLHRWTARHPGWHPAGAFGAEVASYALQTPDGDLLLVDPLLPGGEDDLLDPLAKSVTGNTYIFVTIGYHVRSAEPLSERYGATIHGPETVRDRLTDDASFTPLGDDGPAGTKAYTIGRPRRSERPIFFPSHEAIAFGDALVTTPEGELRMWCQEDRTDHRAAFYRDRFAPTLAPLLEARPRHVLTTHGAPVVKNGTAALQDAIDSEPWFRHG
jgi:hypothetical protein